MRGRYMWMLILTGALTVAAAISLFPTFKVWTMSAEEKVKLVDNPDYINTERKSIKLGLDLRGGMRVVMEVDKSKLTPAEAADAVDRALEIIRNRVDKFGVAEPLIQKQGKDRIVVELPGITDRARATALIGQTAQLEFKLLEPAENLQGITDRFDRALEPQKPAEAKPKPKPATDIFGKTQDTLAAEEPTEKPFSTYLQATGGYFFVQPEDVPRVRELVAKPEVQAQVPPDVEILWSSKNETSEGRPLAGLYFAKKQVELSGKYLTFARENRDPQTGGPIVEFELNREGARIFRRLTGANIGKPLAIILDGKVVSAPVVQNQITNRGQITLGGAGTMEEAHDLAIILRAGALPAPVKIIESSVIGPSLGADSIEKGKLSAVIGISLVFLFMSVYYRLSGLIASIGMLLNFVFLVAILASLGLTLTLPGIAGIILTMGMSVDSNVLIFERIREEMRAGKTVRAAIDAGYKRAMLTIIDSHVTTLITALILFIFGTGPVKGFAVSLSWGIVISLYTAVLVTRAIFEIRKEYQTLSI
ncbi:MAG: protein translocase subunit SecD [candidate division Zixibacteria bacterium]|nr:protein translocase subunit SecD [candidate division Zixibacteria bacterium]